MDRKELSVKQAAVFCGVSERTLRYYDREGLVCPKRTASNYRVYTEMELLRLTEVLFYRELGLPLEKIRDLLDAPAYDRRETLLRQRELLLLRREEIDRTLTLLENTLEETDMKNNTTACGMTYAEAKKRYRAEAEARWGETQAYRTSEAREASRDAAETDAVTAGAGEIFSSFAALAKAQEDPAGEAAQALVKTWQDDISAHWYPCEKPMLAGLGQMYLADERFKTNLDTHGEGTARFMSEAIAAYCRA